jgi:hypothetical protein
MPENSVFVLIDFAGSRDDLASALEQERMGTATEISERTLAIQDGIKQGAKSVRSEERRVGKEC